MLTRRTILSLMLLVPFLGTKPARARAPRRTPRLALVGTDTNLAETIRRAGLGHLYTRGSNGERGYLVIGEHGDSNGALKGFLRKHGRAAIPIERPDALQRLVKGRGLEFYNVRTFLRRTETPVPLDEVLSLFDAST
jgi:hypothetical protein